MPKRTIWSGSFEGGATIRIIFKCRAEYLKFRKYVLKTEWKPCELDCPPYEEMVIPFHCTDDIDTINRQIISLLQMGFDVYCCKYHLENITDEFAERFAEMEELASETPSKVEESESDP